MALVLDRSSIYRLLDARKNRPRYPLIRNLSYVRKKDTDKWIIYNNIVYNYVWKRRRNIVHSLLFQFSSIGPCSRLHTITGFSRESRIVIPKFSHSFANLSGIIITIRGFVVACLSLEKGSGKKSSPGEALDTRVKKFSSLSSSSRIKIDLVENIAIFFVASFGDIL